MVKVVEDIVYGKGQVADDTGKTEIKDLLLDSYVPVGAKKRDKAAMILIHGGGFSKGDKKQRFPDVAQYLAQRGIVCFSINYRMTGDNPPTPGKDLTGRAAYAAVRDTKAAIRWVRANRRKYGISSERIATLGGSAGGYCSVVASITDDDEFASDGPDDPTAAENNPKESSRVDACVDLWGSGGKYIDEMDSKDPPMLIIHGMRDPMVKFSNAEQLRDKCEELGIPYEFHPLDNDEHGQWKDHMDDICRWTVEFLVKHFRLRLR